VWATLLAFALACGDGRPDNAIVVGHFASMTGDTATYGRSADQGMRMAIEKINADGGVPGRSG
jgi:ABC-type branched-subunit amino acid transport system substrate-binding protein